MFFHPQVVAKEIARNLGVQNDNENIYSNDRRYDSTGNSCQNVGGIMDFNQLSVKRWSTSEEVRRKAKEELTKYISRTMSSSYHYFIAFFNQSTVIK